MARRVARDLWRSLKVSETSSTRQPIIRSATALEATRIGRSFWNGWLARLIGNFVLIRQMIASSPEARGCDHRRLPRGSGSILRANAVHGQIDRALPRRSCRTPQAGAFPPFPPVGPLYK